MPLFFVDNDSPTMFQDAQELLRAIRYAEEIANGGGATGEHGTSVIQIGLQMCGFNPSAAYIAGLAAHCADWATGVGIFPEAPDKTVLFAAEAILRFQLDTIPYFTQKGKMYPSRPFNRRFSNASSIESWHVLRKRGSLSIPRKTVLSVHFGRRESLCGTKRVWKNFTACRTLETGSTFDFVSLR